MLSGEIIRYANNPEFGSKELSQNILTWGDKSRTTITFSKELLGNANTVNSKRVTVNWDYAKAIEGILSDKDKKYSAEDKKMAITSFFITMMDETTLVGSKFTKSPIISEGGTMVMWVMI